jgi:protein pelota
VTLIAQDKEDLFVLYNLIHSHDEVTLKTMRNIKKGGAKGEKSEKKLLKLRLSIESVEFTPEDESFRIKGKSMDPVEDVPVGSYHTAEIDYQYPVTIYKESWDQHELSQVSNACNIDAKAEVAAVVLQEGVAHLCLITENMTLLKEKVEKSIPKKRRGDSSAHDKALNRFYELVCDAMNRQLNFTKLKAVILASPGFWAQGVYDKYLELATKNQVKDLDAMKGKFMVTHSSTGFIQGLDEVLKTDSVQKQLADTKYARDVKALDELFKSLNADDGKAWYGPKECEKAVNMGAVKKLLLTDTLFRSDDIQLRKHYASLSEIVKNNGGEVFVFSSLHDSGVQLDQITGVAVLLNYPVYDLDEDEGEDDE